LEANTAFRSNVAIAIPGAFRTTFGGTKAAATTVTAITLVGATIIARAG
jgi:hypothetical protein